MYQAVVLDVDGTLVDSVDAHARAWADALAANGHEVDVARVRPLIGMGGDKLLSKLTGIRASSPEGQAIARQRLEIFERRYIDAVRPLPGTRALLERLRDEGKQLVVASSAEPGELRDLLRIAGALKLVDAIASVDGAGRSKPEPGIVEAAVARTGCLPQEVVMLGDTPYDLEAALRAGIGLIGLRCGGWSDEQLRGAIAIYDDPADLLKRFELSPFCRPLPVRP